jgi:hypothetical protein
MNEILPKPYIYLIVVLSNTALYGKQKFKLGYIITLKRDTVKEYIDYRDCNET